MDKVNRYILAAHPLRHHFRYTAGGIARTERPYRVAVPFVVSERMAKFVGAMNRSLGSTIDYYSYSNLPADKLLPNRTSLSGLYRRFILPRLSVEDFDQFCAFHIRRNTADIAFLHILQDYLPKSAKAARAANIPIVVEQIINTSPAVRRRVAGVAGRWGVSTKSFGLAESEDDNDQILQWATAAICPSDFVMDGLAGRFSGRAFKIPYGVDLSLFKPLAKANNALEFRIVSRAATMRKGAPVALGAILRLIRSPAFVVKPRRLVIDVLGVLEMPEKFGYLVRELRASANVIFREGNRSRIEAADLLGKAHAFLLPSLSEGMSLAVLEAAACGAVPVISPYCGQDGFIHGTHGYVIEDISEEAFAAALGILYQDAHRLAGYQSNLHKLAKGRDWAEFEIGMARAYRNLYDDRATT